MIKMETCKGSTKIVCGGDPEDIGADAVLIALNAARVLAERSGVSVAAAQIRITQEILRFEGGASNAE